MTRFIVDIQKREHTTRQSWGNRWIIDCADLDVGISAGFALLDFEQAIHFDRVDFTNIRVSTQAEFDSSFISTPLVIEGLVASTGKVMPLFCTLSMNLLASGGGRHGLKFFHTCFDDVNYDGDLTYDDSYIAGVVSSAADMFAALSGVDTTLVSPTGSHEYNNVAVNPFVTSHQFTKASKRTLGP